MTRQRSAALTAGAAASAAIVLIAFFKAPVLPVAAGALLATVLLVRRAWRHDAN